VVFGVYAFLQYWRPTVVINYRLTINAITPDGIKTGSSVIQVSYASQFNLNGGGRSGVIKVTGEAVPVDLGQGKLLFVTLTCQASGRGCNSVGLDTAHDAEWLPVRVFGFDWNWGDERKLARQVAAAQSGGPREVPLQALPTIVTFNNIHDPMSVQIAQPENLSPALGQSVVISSARLELTDDVPTVGIGKFLNWLEKNGGGYLDGGFTSVGSPFGLTGLAFKSGGYSP
jgi:hypothetical protein